MGLEKFLSLGETQNFTQPFCRQLAGTLIILWKRPIIQYIHFHRKVTTITFWYRKLNFARCYTPNISSIKNLKPKICNSVRELDLPSCSWLKPAQVQRCVLQLLKPWSSLCSGYFPKHNITKYSRTPHSAIIQTWWHSSQHRYTAEAGGFSFVWRVQTGSRTYPASCSMGIWAL